MQKTNLAIDVSKGTMQDVDDLIDLWNKFQPIVLNNLTPEQEQQKIYQKEIEYAQEKAQRESFKKECRNKALEIAQHLTQGSINETSLLLKEADEIYAWLIIDLDNIQNR